MAPPADRLAAWDRLHDALAARDGWRAHRLSTTPSAASGAPRRTTDATTAAAKVHASVDAEGATEAEAVEALARRLEVSA